MIEPEMRLAGNEDGEAYIECRRGGCMVHENGNWWYFQIVLPYDATPRAVWDLWHEHRIAHANLPTEAPK